MERLPAESPQAYEAYRLYVEMGAERAMERVAQKLGKSLVLMKRWSSKHHWVARATAHDQRLIELEIQAEEAKLVQKASPCPPPDPRSSFTCPPITAAIPTPPLNTMEEPTVIRPQPAQEKFLTSPADIAIYGGAAGGGKSFALLLEPLRHQHRPGFFGVIFRRQATQIKNEGGLWDEAERLYPYLGAVGSRYQLTWQFPSGARLRFAHLEYEQDKHAWMGAQVAFLGFDELTLFTEGQFWYLLSRNRSTCGIRPYVRATCNPDPDSFVASLVSWWLDPATGLAIPERAGVLRWFIRHDDQVDALSGAFNALATGPRFLLA